MKVTVEGGRLAWSMSKLELDALLEHASRDDTRPGLCSVHFDAHEGRAVATDGHRLAMATVDKPAQGGGTFNVARSSLECISKLAGAKQDLLLFPAEGRSSPQIGAIAMVDAALFPPYMQVVPEQQKEGNRKCAGVFGLNLEYLLGMKKVARACGLERTYCARIQTPATSDIAPLRCDFEGYETATKWTVVMMPMRT